MLKVILQIKNLQSEAEEEGIYDRLPLLIGRSRICDVVVQDPILSRQHCSLELNEDGKLVLLDLNSANGTLINGKPIEKTLVQEGEKFQIGDTEVVLKKVELLDEETTVHDLGALAEEETTAPREPKNQKKVETQVEVAPEQGESEQGTVLVDQATGEPLKPAELKPAEMQSGEDKSEEPKAPSKQPSGGLTPAALKGGARVSNYQSKVWVQVSLFWRGELINMSCFDRGDVVTIGKSADNDFVVNFPSLPDHFRFLKIMEQGVEMHLHFSMKGEVETRDKVISIEELRQSARQSDLGLSAMVPFQDRCLIEVGPFELFIRTVRLNLRTPLTAPLVREPFFAGITSSVGALMVLFLFALTLLPQAEAEPEEEEKAVVKLEMPGQKRPPPPPPPPPPPKPKVKPKPKPKKVKKVAQKKKKAMKSSGRSGAGAKASGPEGKRGRKKGTVRGSSRAVGFKTKRAPPRRAPPKGAFGKKKRPSQARKGLRGSQGGGTGTKKRPSAARQAGSKKKAPKVRVEDTGILGVLGGKGGGGKSTSGGVLEGSGLGGELEGGIEGLAQGGAVDTRGSGGRGSKGRGYGGGGQGLNVGGLGTKGKGGGRSGYGLGSSGKKGEAEVNYFVEDVEVRDGLTREEIRRVVDANQSQIQACWDRYIIDQKIEKLSLRVPVEWFVNRSGRAVNIKLKGSIGAHRALFNCMKTKIARWRFPKPRGGSGAQVLWPWTFNH